MIVRQARGRIGPPAPFAPPGDPPVITVDPSDQTVVSGTTASLHVTVTGTAPLTYQWYQGPTGTTTTPVGTNSSSFTTPNLSVDTQYWVRVTNTHGSDDSDTADLTIVEVPTEVLGIPTYLGCFRVAASPNFKTGSQQTYGCITGRKVAGKVRLFYTGNEPTDGGPIIEIEDPESYGSNYLTAPEGVVKGYWYATNHRDLRGTWRGAAQSDPPAEPFFVIGSAGSGSACQTQGLYWHEGNQLLYIGYSDSYNVAGMNDWGLIAVELGALSGSPPTGNTTGHGPWRIKATDADGVHLYGPWRAAYFHTHPTSGKMFVGATLGSGNASSSWGPAMYGGLTWPTASTPSGISEPDLVVPDRYTNYYFMGGKLQEPGTLISPHVLRSFRRRVDPPIYESGGAPVTQVNGQSFTDAIGLTGSWNERDYAGGHIWIQGSNKHGVLVCGVWVGSPSQDENDPHAGHEFYGNTTNNFTCPDHGFVYQEVYPEAQPPNTGPLSFHSFPFLMCFDPADLEAVKNTSNDYTVEPVWAINLETQFPGFHAAPISTSKYATIAGFYYDSDTMKLYLMTPGADNSTF